MNTTAVADPGVQDEVKTAQPSGKAEESKESVKSESVTEDDKMADLQESEKDKKPLPFNEHPAWKRQIARSRALQSRVEELSGGLKEALGLLKSLKGEEPEAPAGETETDYDTLLKSEISELADRLDEEGEEADLKSVEEISRRYAVEVDGKKVYLPAESAYKIWRDFKNTQSAKESVPSTRPSGRGSEGKATDLKNLAGPEDRKKESWGQMMSRLKRVAEYTQ